MTYRAIYVGDAKAYGRTGTVDDPKAVNVVFRPDGHGGDGTYIARKHVYIPALDKTRHCPKP